MIRCLQLVCCTTRPMTSMFNVPQERRLQITVDGPIDLLTELNALQLCCNETYTLLVHVKILLMLLLRYQIMIMWKRQNVNCNIWTVSSEVWEVCGQCSNSRHHQKGCFGHWALIHMGGVFLRAISK